MTLLQQSRHCAAQLKTAGLRVVFAESCTAGLVSASLARVPGISEYLCGSAVTYREETKQAWLDVSASDLKRHTAVSEPVARQMALGALRRTEEADLSASVTGHLGPGAPDGFDGVVYIGVARRRGERLRVESIDRIELPEVGRYRRQQQAALEVLLALSASLSQERA